MDILWKKTHDDGSVTYTKRKVLKAYDLGNNQVMLEIQFSEVNALVNTTDTRIKSIADLKEIDLSQVIIPTQQIAQPVTQPVV